MLQLLRTLDPFANLDHEALHTVMQHATRIDLPAGRRLRQSGKPLRGNYYLLRGKLKDLSSAAVVTPSARPILAAAERISAKTLADTLASIVTLTPAQLLHVDIEPIAFLLESSQLRAQPGESEEDSWQVRFLRSYMLAPLPLDHWQKILNALEARHYQAGEWVFRHGDQGEQCFIVAQGQGRVVRRSELVRQLGPGDFFGEDALFGGVGRNAGVQMCSAGRLMLLDAQIFHRWLADLLIAGEGLAGLHSSQQVKTLMLDAGSDLRTCLQALDPCISYRVQGDDQRSRLAVFLLRQRGIRAELLRPIQCDL